MSEPDPVGFHERLSDEDKACVLGLNAAALLGLEWVV
jgi:aminocarboxymuconate-semialdehyde decarboxylase